jgi:6-phosphogluconolactonase/glucosamine-6-phosphate isomerase/deaminase
MWPPVDFIADGISAPIRHAADHRALTPCIRRDSAFVSNVPFASSLIKVDSRPCGQESRGIPFMKRKTAKFTYEPAAFIPFRDRKILDRVRAIKRENITKHRNSNYRIRVVPDADVEFLWMNDMFHRIKTAMEQERPFVMIMPNPWPRYAQLADMLNTHRINCRWLHTFNMDEYANEKGEIAPETWELGFMHAFKKHFWSNLDPKLRPPARQVHGPTNRNIKIYGKMLADLGGADICYSGPGWTGHLAFIDPGSPEFAASSLNDWRHMGPRICTLHPLTIAQNSLHGSFGSSGDVAAVPPMAATIGPAEVVAAKHRVQIHAISISGTFSSWQRLTSRLVMHGPVTPLVPESLLQTLRTDVWVSETIAADVKPRWEYGY